MSSSFSRARSMFEKTPSPPSLRPALPPPSTHPPPPPHARPQPSHSIRPFGASQEPIPDARPFFLGQELKPQYIDPALYDDYRTDIANWQCVNVDSSYRYFRGGSDIMFYGIVHKVNLPDTGRNLYQETGDLYVEKLTAGKIIDHIDHNYIVRTSDQLIKVHPCYVFKDELSNIKEELMWFSNTFEKFQRKMKQMHVTITELERKQSAQPPSQPTSSQPSHSFASKPEPMAKGDSLKTKYIKYKTKYNKLKNKLT